MNLHINSVPINMEYNVKFLGVKINEDVKWTNHVSYIVNKINKYIGIFSIIRHFTPQTTLNNLYLHILH